MLTVRRAEDRFHTDIGWLDSWHTFSFGEHDHPRWRGFSVLRVLNDDRVEPARGFGTHGHRDMEILSWVLEGQLAHKDSMGNGSVIKPGDIQRMSAGTGVLHSEQNPSRGEGVHFLQIWLLPERGGLAPGYEQKHLEDVVLRNQLRVVASRDGADGAVRIHQDASLAIGRLDPGVTVTRAIPSGRRGWVHVARGSVTVNDETLAAGDGAGIVGPLSLAIAAKEDSEVLVFDLP